MRRLSRRTTMLCMLGTCLLVLAAPAAMADPAKPTNYESSITEITPATPLVHLDVVGGDGFLEMTVTSGHTVAVAGYEGEPWLRVLADGRVQENQRSTATYLNSNRYGKVVIPPGVGRQEAIDKPEWRTVAHGGHYVWHDHRIHYMTPEIAPHLVPGTNRVMLGARDDGQWVVPLTVDGKPVEVIGELRLLDAPAAVLWWGIAVATAAALAVAGGLWQRRAALGIGIAAIGLAGLVGVAAGLSELSVVPSEAGGTPIAVALPGFATAAALIGLVLRNRATRCIAVLAGAAALLAWAILRAGALSHALPLSGLPPATARLAVALVLGGSLGAAVAAVRSGALALSPLDDGPAADPDDP